MLLRGIAGDSVHEADAGRSGTGCSPEREPRGNAGPDAET